MTPLHHISRGPKMLNVNQLFRSAVQAGTTNAPSLLTAFGAVGVFTTAVLATKAGYQSAGVIYDAKLDKTEQDTGLDRSELEDATLSELTKAEMAKACWLLYLPAATSGVVTIGAVILSHRVSSRRAAVLAAAYALNEGKLEEYQAKVKEKFGEKKEHEVRDEIAQDRVNRDHDDGAIIFHPMEGLVLIKDNYSGRTYWGSLEKVKQTVNEINQEILINGSATLTDFYLAIGLDKVATSDYFGWNTRERCEIDWSTCTTPSGAQAVHVFDFINEPIMNPGANASF